jgi:Ca2+-binding RTX toxin-like protein
MFGGAGNDVLVASGGSNLHLYGLEGDNLYQITGSAEDPVSVALNDLGTFGKGVGTTEGRTLGINTIIFVGVTTGIQLDLSNTSAGALPTNPGDPGTPQEVAPGVTLSLTGLFQNVFGTEGNDQIKGNASANLLWGGFGGNDTLIGGTGAATLVAGSGDDSLVAGSGGTTFRFDPLFAPDGFGTITVDPPDDDVLNTLDFSTLPDAVQIDMGASAPQTVAPGLTLILEDPLTINALIDTPFDDHVVGNGAGNHFFLSAGDDTVFGGSGSDAYYFRGNHLGSDTLVDSATGNALNFLSFGGPVDLDLRNSGLQVVNHGAASSLSLTLPDPMAFSTVIGSSFGDTIIGNNAADQTLIGAGGGDAITAGSGNVYIQGYVTQVVLIDFEESAAPNAHLYTPAEKAAIRDGLTADFSDFNYFFTLDRVTARQIAEITGGRYATVKINQGTPGGSSTDLDVGNLDLGGIAYVNVTPFFGESRASIPVTSDYIIGITTTIAAHELGHLAGLQHQDAFGPIGAGLYAGSLPGQFYPHYLGLVNGSETPSDLMASPESVGTTLLDAAGDTHLGERDAVKLAFNDTGLVVNKQNLSSEAVGISTVLPLPTGDVPFTIESALTLGHLPNLVVPNTLPVGAVHYGLEFSVTAIAVNGSVAGTQADFYSFHGHAGQILNIQAISANNTSNPHPFPPELVLVSPSGQVIAYNANGFESTDSTLLDVLLPEDGTYLVGIDSLVPVTRGDYQLFLYTFRAGPALGGGDTMIGGGGNDTVVGSSGNDLFTFLPGSQGFATLIGGSGHDVLDLRPAPGEHVTTTGNFTFFVPDNDIVTATLSAAPTPSVYGQTITLTAAVSDGSGAILHGLIEFFDVSTSTSLGFVATENNLAAFNVSSLDAGAHEIVARFLRTDPGFYDYVESNTISHVVEQRVLNISATGVDRRYDATTDAEVTLTDDRFAGDDLSVTYASAQFADKNVGSNKAIAVTGIQLGGADAGNYIFSTSILATATITPALLTVQADNASTVYGQAASGFTYTITGYRGDDSAADVSGAPDLTTTATASSPVGVYTIAASAGTLSAENYTFAFVDGQLSVTKASLGVTVDADASTAAVDPFYRVYGADNPNFGVRYSGFVLGEDASVLGGTLLYITSAVPSSDVGTYVVGAAGLMSSNYAIIYHTGAIDVTPAPLTIQVDADPSTSAIDSFTKVYGQANPAFGVRYDGFVLGQTAGVLSGTLSIATSATSASHVGGYAVQASGLTSLNYAVSFIDGTLNITPASLTITADDKMKQEGQANPVFTASYVGFVNGDTPASLSTLPTFATTATTASPAGAYPITVSGAASDDYAIAYVDGTLTVMSSGSNAAPAITSLTTSASSEATASIDGAVTLTGAFTDVNAGDTHHATIAWGDGQTTSLTEADIDQAGDAFQASHDYGYGGAFQVTVTLYDNHGAGATQTTWAYIVGVGLHDGVLEILGTGNRDTAQIHQHDDTIVVHTLLAAPGSNDGSDEEPDDDYDSEEVHYNHQRFEFNAADVESILIHAGGGNDRIYIGRLVNTPAVIDGGAGDDWIHGGAGNDTITDLIGDNRVRAGQGNDVITLGDGDNRVWTDGGDDSITAGNGDNELHVGHGVNVVLVGDGNNRIWTDGGIDQINAGDGDNEIHAGGEADTIFVGDGDNRIWTSGDRDFVQTGDGDNEIHAGQGDDTIVTGRGDDKIWTDGGNDSIQTGDGNNEVHAGHGNNFILTGAGDDKIWAGNGNDVIFAGDGNNEIHAGAGNNVIVAGIGHDKIWTDGGNDSINAGNGNNEIRTGAGNDSVAAGSGNDLIFSEAGQDLIRAGAGNDEVRGGSGDDILLGGDGNDVLIGDSGRDLLIGGFGSDQIIGNAEEDILIAGNTSYDNTDAALAAIMSLWTSSASYASRISALSNVSAATHLVGDDGAWQTVFSDSSIDKLTGSAGQDWFLANQVAENGGALDQVIDNASNETWTDTDL